MYPVGCEDREIMGEIGGNEYGDGDVDMEMNVECLC